MSLLIDELARYGAHCKLKIESLVLILLLSSSFILLNLFDFYTVVEYPVLSITPALIVIVFNFLFYLLMDVPTAFGLVVIMGAFNITAKIFVIYVEMSWIYGLVGFFLSWLIQIGLYLKWPRSVGFPRYMVQVFFFGPFYIFLRVVFSFRCRKEIAEELEGRMSILSGEIDTI